MTDPRPDETAALRERIDLYLLESGLAGGDVRVVPLTGDASDRRYFRIIPPDGPSVVLALHAGPIEFATLPFANVANLLQQVPLRSRPSSATRTRSGSSRSAILAT